MELFNKLQDAITDLFDYGCLPEDLVIAYSPIVKRMFEYEASKHHFHSVTLNMNGVSMMGVKAINELHPYNELIVYHKSIWYRPNLIRKVGLVDKYLEQTMFKVKPVEIITI